MTARAYNLWNSYTLAHCSHVKCGIRPVLDGVDCAPTLIRLLSLRRHCWHCRSQMRTKQRLHEGSEKGCDYKPSRRRNSWKSSGVNRMMIQPQER